MIDEKSARTERCVASLLGMAVGDALGLPANGLTPYDICRKFQFIDGFFPVSNGVKPGQYSDCSRLALFLAASILEEKTIDKKAVIAAHYAMLSRPKPLAEWLLGIQRANGGSPFESCGAPRSMSSEFLLKMVPVGIYAGVTGMEVPDLIKACKLAAMMTHSFRPTVLSGFVISRFIRELIKNHDVYTKTEELYQTDKSLLATTIEVCRRIEEGFIAEECLEDSLSERLLFTRRRLQDNCSITEFVGLHGNSRDVNEIVPFSIFSFLKSPDDFKTICQTASLGGAANITAGLVGAMCGAHAGLIVLPESKRDVENHVKIMSLGKRLSE